MSDAIIPGVIAAGGGSALAVGIFAREARAEAAMRTSRIRLELTFPRGVDPIYAKAALSGLAGLSDRLECVFEVEATTERVRHFLYVPVTVRESVVSTLTGAMPGLRTREARAHGGRATVAATVFVPTPTTLSTENPEAAARTLLSGITGLGKGEYAAIRFAVRAGSSRTWQPKEPPDRAARQIEREWQRKTSSGPGFQVAGLIVVRAPSVTRAREICEHLMSSLRSRRGSVGTLRITTERGSRNLAATPKITRSSGWVTTTEALGLFALPLGDPIPGVEVGAARELAVPKFVPSSGRRLFVGRDSRGNLRPVALSPQAARLHLALFGGTGSGKTTVLLRVILDALAEGTGGVFLDPKDATSTLIEHVPPEYADRVVVLDPSQAGPLPGLALFGGGDAAMRSDVILTVLRGVSEGWGSRIDRYLRLGLRSLSVLPDPVLADWLRLYGEPSFRRQVISRITDPVIAAEWRSFEQGLSPAEQQSFVAPAMARITDLLSRPAVRAVLSQPTPLLNIERLLAEGRWLVVALSPGTLGEPAARLLGAVVSYLVWAAVEKRAALPEGERRQVMFVLDELQSLANLPVGLEVFFERFRSLNCAVVVATQSAARLPESVRQSLFANVGSLVAWRSGADEAARLARELAPLTATDLMSLARWEVGARISTGDLGSGSAIITGHTEPLPAPTGSGALIRRLTAERYGRDPGEIEDALRRRMSGGGEERAGEGGYGRTGRAA